MPITLIVCYHFANLKFVSRLCDWFAAKLQRQRPINARNTTRSTDRNDVISNVPAIISTSASPTHIASPVAGLAVPTKRHGRVLQKSNGVEQMSIGVDAKSPHASNMNQRPHQYSQTKSDDLAYCTKCGGLTSYDKLNLTKKRYFSLDKERNEKAANFLQCFAINPADTAKSGSDNLLSSSRKQCSLDGGTSEKSFGRISNRAKEASDGSNHTKDMVINSSLKKPNTHRECSTSWSNRSLKDKSNKSSQNSLRETRTSRKNSIFHFGSSDREGSVHRSKRISQQYARKASTRGPIDLLEEQDSETREILLGRTTSHTKFDKFSHEIKIPEPVEAVCVTQSI